MADAKSTNSKDDTMTTRAAGKIGGDKVKNEKGPEFYSQIGGRQGKQNNPGNFANRPKDEVRNAAEKGGHNSHKNDDSHVSEEDQS